MELKNGLPVKLSLDKDVITEELVVLKDNGGMRVATLRLDRTFSDNFNSELANRYNSHDGLKDVLQKMVDAFGHYCEGDPSDDEVEALKEAMELVK